MTDKRKRRLALIGMVGIGVAAAIALILMALQENINLFYSPTQVANNEAPLNHNFRLGGLVADNSVKRTGKDKMTVEFVVTDNAKNVTVHYTGILPDLFREGQGIVALGKLTSDGSFNAEEVLAKHDENYMPPEVAEALDKAHNDATNNQIPLDEVLSAPRKEPSPTKEMKP